MELSRWLARRSASLAPAGTPRDAATHGASLSPENDVVLRLQVALARQGISSGPVDGVLGSQTRSALAAFQKKAGLPVTGEPDETTRDRLLAFEKTEPLWTVYFVTGEDLARLHPVGQSWLAKSEQKSLDYESALELLAEKSHAHPDLLRRLNAGFDWQAPQPGSAVLAPNLAYPETTAAAAEVRVHLSENSLEAFDRNGTLLAHFPCSIARRVEKRPVGELHVATVIPEPNYTFDPKIFPDSEEGRTLGRKLILPPGPNNPVGSAWIGLDRPGYGIHGTPSPEAVGRTESHGCFRLANWDAIYLTRLVDVGTPVFVEP